ncbi:hypothetical protein [Natronosalvus rutilus]|uniref:Uncharacterized protein n=1 Tax=Natronosalvus rutilus TaxID=2953753 RepID=A0A9E7N807_9EURY|nr:hypothetical protein [Natronosalvus rutilus]UTF52581.1 hypothetical protein NGM29_12380 [Natronosalvus rutilus]
MQSTLVRILAWSGVGLSAVWAVAIVLLVLGRFTPLPSFDLVASTVVVGGILATVLGIGQLLRNGYRWLVDR